MKNLKIITIKNLTKTFSNTVEVLNEVNFDVNKGEFLSIVGASGCGKTTLLRILAGLEKKTKGHIDFHGKDIDKIGFVFQSPNLMPWRTVLENIALLPELDNMGKEERIKLAQEAVDLMGLSGFENFLPSQISGGMSRRVGIARALANNPEVLFLDEPLSGLDEISREKMNVLLRNIQTKTDKTIIYITHDITEAIFLSDRVIVMSSRPGRIKKIFKIDLPKERRHLSIKDTDVFIKIQGTIRKALGQAEEEKNACENIPMVPDKTRIYTDKIKIWGQSVFILFFFLSAWKGSVSLMDIPDYILPPPDAILSTYWDLIKTAHFWNHTLITFNETILGFCMGTILGFCLGYPLGNNKTLMGIFAPYIIAIQTAPKIAFAPIIVLWFGFGILSKAIIATLIVFFPVFINTILGIKSIAKDQKELMRTAGATWLQYFLKLELPSILPALFAGLKTSITLAVIGAVVGEFVGAKGGLGYLTNFASGELHMTLAFASLLQLMILGLFLFGCIYFLEHFIVYWCNEDDE